MYFYILYKLIYIYIYILHELVSANCIACVCYSMIADYKDIYRYIYIDIYIYIYVYIYNIYRDIINLSRQIV